MILFPTLNEAGRVISEGVVIRSSDLDVASVLGMGFPSYRSLQILLSIALPLTDKILIVILFVNQGRNPLLV